MKRCLKTYYGKHSKKYICRRFENHYGQHAQRLSIDEHMYLINLQKQGAKK
jgi:hypothetical protein